MDTRRYAELFLTESRDNLSAINHSLLELERDPGAEAHVGALFRAVHTVKGMSATMGYTAVAALSHEMETLLDIVRRGERAVSPAMMDALFEAADALEQAIERSVADRGHEVDVSGPVAALRAVAGSEVIVRVTQAADTPMRGVRAYLAVERARTLGTVVDVAPAIDALQAERFEREFAIRLVTGADDAAIEQTVRSAGGVEAVRVDRGRAVTSGVVAPGTVPNDYPVSGEPPATLGGIMSASAGAASEHAAARQHRHVRIDLQRLDTLMNLIGELVIMRGRLQQLATTINDAPLTEAVAQTSRLVADLQDGIMTSRMVPVWQVFDRFPRVVRDAARALGKQVDFGVEGREIELDRSMLDEIGDPVIHLLRNAIDHGLETPEQRRAAGKPAVGRLSLVASRDRSAVVIRVTDDGRGIDRERVLARAKQNGLVEAAKLDLSDDELLRLIARPGFSTAERVTDISGRGVGIDAVYTRVRALGGTVDIKSTKGQGTTVTVRLPVTLAIVRALLARVGDETYAVPMTHVNETVQLEPSTVRRVKGREVLVLRDDVLPLLHLRDLVRLPRRDGWGGQVVVVEVAERRAGMVVDDLTGQQEIVIKPFDAVKDGLSLFSGATILGDGVPALILDVSSLL